MQIGRVRFARVKCHDYPFPLSIDAHIAHTWNSHEWGAQFSHAFITILAFGRDRDPLQNRLVRTLQVVRIRWIEVMRIEWFGHRLSLLVTVAPCPHHAQAAQFSVSTVSRRFSQHITCHSEAAIVPSGGDNARPARTEGSLKRSHLRQARSERMRDPSLRSG